MEKTADKETKNESDKSEPLHKEDYGYYFYPSRKMGEGRLKEHTVWDSVKKGWFATEYSRCNLNVLSCSVEDPAVKLMLRALNAHGCPVDMKRHVSCEPCKQGVSGGFDSVANQVVLCERAVKLKRMTCSAMGHELVHAFDKCRAKLDFKDPRHVACTEIRAANLFHCSYLSSWVRGDFYVDGKLKHQDCVKGKALHSLLLIRSLSEEEGKKIIDEVFDRCYNDLEPIGRRMRPGTTDPQRALSEGVMYGYTDKQPPS